MGNAPLPGQINYSKLSPIAVETLAEIGLRAAAGWSSEEIASEFNRTHARFRHLPPPSKSTFTSGWINQRMKALREEIVASVDAVH